MEISSLTNLDALRQTLKDPARDMKVNLESVLRSEFLNDSQVWGTLLASVYYIRDQRLRDAVTADAQAAAVDGAVLEDAQAAASLMGMNTVYYRFRHLVGKPSYTQRPAKLRMQWMARPKTNKSDYELMSLAVAVLAGCESCIKSHEASILQNGLTEEHVQDCVRIAAVLQGAAVALQL